MTTAVDARKLIGQAMGILMERFNLDSDHAFQVLKRFSQSSKPQNARRGRGTRRHPRTTRLTPV